MAGAKRTVLVVEDNELNREMLCNILESDYDVVQAVDGLDGLMQLGLHFQKLSLILLDVYMPGCDGFEFLRRKQSDERLDTIPVIVTTASDEPEDEIRCLELGANDFVRKPYNPAIILNRMGNLIRLRESASMVNSLTWDTSTGLYSKEFFYHAVEDALTAYPDAQYDIVCSDIENYLSLVDRYGDQSFPGQLFLFFSRKPVRLAGEHVLEEVAHRAPVGETGIVAVDELLEVRARSLASLFVWFHAVLRALLLEDLQQLVRREILE